MSVISTVVILLEEKLSVNVVIPISTMYC